MTFSKVRSTWASNSTMTSAEIQTLDTDHGNSADKSTAGDTIAGVWTFQSGSAISASAGSVFTYAGTSTFQNLSTTTFLGVGTQVGDGTNPGTLTITASGTLIFNAASVLTIKTTALITASGVLKTTTGGRFTLGDNDYFVLGPGHSGLAPVRRMPFGPLAGTMPTGFVYNSSGGTGVLGSGAATPGNVGLPLSQAIWNGATITTLKLLFTPNTTHTGLPANNITAALKVHTPNIGSTDSLTTLGAAGVYSPVSLADYNNGNVHALVIPCGSVVIDSTQNEYVLGLTDENGANALNNNIYHGLEFTLSITDLRPQ